jgi:peroxiredoxin/glutaredoxin
MFQNREGQRVPDVTFRVRVDGAWKDVTSRDLFAGRTVVLFALPGAFTPTCSTAHVPRYDELAEEFGQLGVDEILCLSVNDSFVMNAWQQDQCAEHITFVPDGNGEFTEKMGMLVPKDDLGFGRRSWRYSMLVRDGVIDKMFVEPEEPGDPFGVSDADTMLRWLGGRPPHDIVLFTRPGCVHCVRAKRLLQERRLPYAELPTSPRILRALPGPRTTPQVFIDGKHIGGADDLAAWLTRESDRAA